MDVAVSGLRIAAHSGDGGKAAVLDIGKVSGHLGAIRAPAVQLQTLSASLLRQPRGGPPAHGLRLAAAGVTVSIAQHLPQSSMAAATAEPTGDELEAVTNAVEVQLLLSLRSTGGSSVDVAREGFPSSTVVSNVTSMPNPEPSVPVRTAHTTGRETATYWALWAAIGSVAVQLSAQHLVDLMAIISESAAPHAPSEMSCEASATLGDIIVVTSPMHLASSPLGTSMVSENSPGSSGSKTDFLEASMSSVRVTVNVARHLKTEGGLGCTHLVLHSIRASAGDKGFSLRVPMAEVGYGRQQRRPAMLPMPTLLIGLKLTVDANADPTQRQQIRLSLTSVSLALTLSEWVEAARFAGCLCSGPLLPDRCADQVVTSDAPEASPDIAFSVASVVISIDSAAKAGSQSGKPAAACLLAAQVQISSSAAQVRFPGFYTVVFYCCCWDPIRSTPS